MKDFNEWTQASYSADAGMKVPEGIMSFASDGRGKPTTEQRCLYLGAIAFTYAVWESYIEDVAVELVTYAAREISEKDVPTDVQELIAKGASPWQLAVHPGWRGLWVDRIRQMTHGEGKPGSWGLNTASFQQCEEIFAAIGLKPLPQKIKAPDFGAKGNPWVPYKISVNRDGMIDVPHALQLLISIRGEAVHTAKTTDDLYKQQVRWWDAFVRTLYIETDKAARRQLAEKILQRDYTGKDILT